LSEAAAGDPGGPAAGGSRRARAGGLGARRTGAPAADPRLAAAIFAALVLACFMALIVTQRLKHTPTPVERFQMTSKVAPSANGRLGEERIAFKLTKADRVTVSIENSSGEDVATLVTDVPVGRYKTLSLRWNGRRGVARGYKVLRKADGYTTIVPRNTGAIAPTGTYTVRVHLLAQKRSVPSSRSFQLVAP
jgi:hypothetical protein